MIRWHSDICRYKTRKTKPPLFALRPRNSENLTQRPYWSPTLGVHFFHIPAHFFMVRSFFPEALFGHFPTTFIGPKISMLESLGCVFGRSSTTPTTPLLKTSRKKPQKICCSRFSFFVFLFRWSPLFSSPRRARAPPSYIGIPQWYTPGYTPVVYCHVSLSYIAVKKIIGGNAQISTFSPPTQMGRKRCFRHPPTVFTPFSLFRGHPGSEFKNHANWPLFTGPIAVTVANVAIGFGS